MTQATRTATGRLTFATGAFVSLLTMSVAFAPIAAAQAKAPAPTLTAKLMNNVTCSERDASRQLMRNVVNSGAKRTDLMAALDDLSIDRTVCAEIKDAASSLALDLANDDPAPQPTTPAVVAEADPAADAQAELDAVNASVERMQRALDEADRQAAAMRFEVGPPPRNLTRSRPVSP